jgi:hypothetical protein
MRQTQGIINHFLKYLLEFLMNIWMTGFLNKDETISDNACAKLALNNCDDSVVDSFVSFPESQIFDDYQVC